MKEVEKEAILAAIAETGDVQMACRALGLGRTTVYRRLRDWGIKTDPRRRAVIDQAASLASIPIRRFLVLPKTKKELKAADLRCPKCQSFVMLPNGDK